MAQLVIQKQITDPTNPKQIPKVMQPLTKPVAEPAKAKPKPQYKPIPEETRILLDGLEEIGEIIYAMRQKIWQLYGPTDYTQKPDPTVTAPKPIPITKPQTKTPEPTILKNNLGDELATFTIEDTKIYIRPNYKKAFNINTPPFGNFYVERVLVKIREKNPSFNYQILQANDILNEIIITGATEEIAKELQASTRWTLEKMFEKQQTPRTA